MINLISKKVAEFWDKNMGKHLGSFDHWETPEPIRKHQNIRVTGNADVTHLDWFYERYGPFHEMASIGSGNGILEKHVCHLKMPSDTIVGYDISPASLETARASCIDFQNCFFEVADLNIFEWPKSRFDVVFAHGALHHIKNLDWCIGQINSSLKADGLLYVNDYVGPDRFQWTELQMIHANALLHDVPDKWKLRSQVQRCDEEKLSQDDPSEAVCSSHIESTVAHYFSIVERKPRGGTLLAPIFGSGCIDKSILNSKEGLACLQKLAEKEGSIIDRGIVPSDHVVVVAKKTGLSRR